jgi:hypothetical protein
VRADEVGPDPIGSDDVLRVGRASRSEYFDHDVLLGAELGGYGGAHEARRWSVLGGTGWFRRGASRL